MEGNRSSKKGPRPSTLISILSVGWTKSMVEMKTLDVCGNFPPLLASHTPPSYSLLASTLFLPWLLLSLRRRRLYAPSSVAHDLPRWRRSRRPPSPAPMRPPAGGPLPGGCACADLRSHLVAAPARPPSGGPCVAPRRCYKPRCRCTLAAGSSLAFHGHGKPHEHHGHDEPAPEAFGEAISELRQYDQGAHGGYFR